jgi:hypothetical protein
MRYVSITATLAVLAGLAVLAAGDPTARAADKDKWGTIKGKIIFDGKPPAQGEVVGLKGHDDEKHCRSKGELLTEDWVVDPKTKGVQWVLVWLAPDPASEEKTLPIHPSLAKVPSKAAVMDQPCCKFIPHVLALREGQTWVIKNSSPVKHNVNYVGHPRFNKGENVVISPGDKHVVDGAKALKAQKLPLSVSCNLHKWMNARVAVFAHPYFAVTKKDGSFEIKNAPAGTFRLFVWQESMGYRGGEKGADGEKITIKPGGVTDLGKLKIKPE